MRSDILYFAAISHLCFWTSQRAVCEEENRKFHIYALIYIVTSEFCQQNKR